MRKGNGKNAKRMTTSTTTTESAQSPSVGHAVVDDLEFRSVGRCHIENYALTPAADDSGCPCWLGVSENRNFTTLPTTTRCYGFNERRDLWMCFVDEGYLRPFGHVEWNSLNRNKLLYILFKYRNTRTKYSEIICVDTLTG